MKIYDWQRNFFDSNLFLKKKTYFFLIFFSRDVTSNQKFSAMNPKIPVGVAYFVISRIRYRKKQAIPYKIRQYKISHLI